MIHTIARRKEEEHEKIQPQPGVLLESLTQVVHVLLSHPGPGLSTYSGYHSGWFRDGHKTKDELMKTVPELSRTIGKRGTLGAEFVECKPRMVNGHLCFLNEQST